MGTKTTGKGGKADSPVGPGGKGRAVASTASSRPGETDTVAAVGVDSAYLSLIRRFPLRPIRDDGELDAASALLDELTERDDLVPAEADYLEVLGDLVEKYEEGHIEMPHVSDAEMLRCLMEERGVRQAEVVRESGISKTVLSLVLNGKRELTREHIEILSRYFGVNPAAFLGST
jgi:HTH-type transcriptional regulator/antitoxin HigA